MLGGNHFLNLTSNIFENNLAKLAGAAIYFNNSILVESPKQNNVFIGNKAALFANDFYTFPVRTIYFDGQEKNLTKYKYLALKNVLPGITNITLNFLILDYYGQIIKSLNGRYFSYF